MANKDFVWFLNDIPNFLEVWAIEQALEDVMSKDHYGREKDGKFYILTSSEDEWREKMKKLKSAFDFYMSEKFLITFTSKLKMEKAQEYLDNNLIFYNQNPFKDEIIVHCLSFKQKALIEELKKYVRTYVPKHVTI